MIHLAYIAFTYILIGEVIVFLLLTLPTPPGLKSTLVRLFMGSRLRSTLMWVHLALCVLAGVFFLDLAQTEVNFQLEKERLRDLGDGNVGTEVRMGYLAYQIQRVERNKYITSMLIYASIVLNLYIRMLYVMYRERGDYDHIPASQMPEELDKVESPTKKGSSISKKGSQLSEKTKAQ